MIKKYIDGFFMCWGNFFFIPSPVKKWRDDCKGAMLSWLPTIGLFIGSIWMLITLLLFRLQCPIYITSFILTFVPFLLSGFMHVDGFMDCSDALSSWGTVSKKQEILKDSRVGSGSVIRIIFYVLCYFAMLTTGLAKSIYTLHLLMIIITPRFISVLFVMLSKKIGEDEEATVKSQYVGLKEEGLIFLLVQMLIYTIIYFVISPYPIQNIIILLSAIIGTSISILIAKTKLNGMNGDIAGFGIMWGELIAVISLAVM